MEGLMAKGVVLCKGDKTTCGGKIIAGTALGIAFGKPQAREGDPGVVPGSGGGYLGGEYLSRKGEVLGESIYEVIGK